MSTNILVFGRRGGTVPLKRNTKSKTILSHAMAWLGVSILLEKTRLKTPILMK